MDSSNSRLRLTGGRLHDPAQGWDGLEADLWIADGRIVNEPDDPSGFTTIQLQGRVVMAGGIDMHCHVAGPKVNHGRRLQPEVMREHAVAGQTDGQVTLQAGVDGTLPTLARTGYQYLGLGYTTCFDAAISPLACRQAHFDFRQIPNVDAGLFALVGNNHMALECAAKGDAARMDAFLGWLLNRVGGYAPKIVNPGGVEQWKHRRQGNARDLDQTIDGFQVTPRQILLAITSAANRIGLPHPVHIHTNNLGIPGNWTTTLETMKTVAGQRAHLTHIQFHSYGGQGEHEDQLTSQVAPLAEFINEHPELSVDVGQVLFGRTTSMTGDAPLGYFLHQIDGRKWYASDTELESGCGVSPIEYRNRNRVNAWQWAIGLEWYLRVNDPWQVVMSTDHPNGGSFRAYPHIIRLLMDREFRREQVSLLHPQVAAESGLADLEREYSLNEIAIITRAGPARLLGLQDRGHLAPGGLADVCVYTPSDNYETMFSLPWMVIKRGQVLIEDAQLRQLSFGQPVCAATDCDPDRAEEFETWFEEHYSVHPMHYGVQHSQDSPTAPTAADQQG